MNKTEEFLDIYKTLEQTAVSVYGFPADGTAVSRLEKLNEYKNIRPQLKYCREVRALLTHNPMLNGEYAVIPSDEMIQTLRFVTEKIKCPEKCADRAVKGDKIMAASPKDKVLPKMLLMKKYGFSFLPILNYGCVVGVFGKNTVFSLALEDFDAVINEKTRFCDISQYTRLVKSSHDAFRFIPKNMSVSEAENLVIDAFRKKVRINLLFLTETGSPDEKLFGILTPWDVMNN